VLNDWFSKPTGEDQNDELGSLADIKRTNMTTPQKITSAVGAVVLLVAALVVLSFLHTSAPQIAFSCVGVSASSNTSLVSIRISNQSASSIVYFVGSPVLKSNGVWGSLQYPAGTNLVLLGSSQTATAVVTAASVNGEARVPVLWGFTYSPKATRWQEIQEDAVAWLRMHDFRGRGALYTNYVAGIKL